MLSLVYLYTGTSLHILQLPTAKLAVLREFLHAEVHIPLQLVGIALVDELLHHVDDIRNMLRNLWIQVSPLYIQLVHGLKIAGNVTLADNGCLYSLGIGSLDDLIVHIGKVLNMLYLIAPIAEIPLDYIPGNKRTGIADMWVIVWGNAANIHAYLTWLLWDKLLFFSGKSIVNLNHFLSSNSFSSSLTRFSIFSRRSVISIIRSRIGSGRSSWFRSTSCSSFISAESISLSKSFIISSV